MKRTRVDWTDSELDTVAAAMVEYIVDNPDYTSQELFEFAQSRLPAGRRRKHTKAFTQAPFLLEVVKDHFSRLKAHVKAAQPATIDYEALIREKDEQLAGKEKTIEELREEIAALRGRPSPAEFLELATTEQLLAILLRRVTGVFNASAAFSEGV